MSLVNSLLKIFVGDKAKQDISKIQPIVKKIKAFEPTLENVSNDELRATGNNQNVNIKHHKYG